jgi:hypothetical protein
VKIGTTLCVRLLSRILYSYILPRLLSLSFSLASFVYWAQLLGDTGWHSCCHWAGWPIGDGQAGISM